MLGNYLGSKEKKKTAVIEFNKHNEFEEIQKFCTDDSNIGSLGDKFKIANTTYYKNVSEPTLLGILNEDYEYIIYDFGCDYEKNQNEFLRCSKKIVVGSLSEWKYTQYCIFLDNMAEERKKGKWEFLELFGNGYAMDNFRKKYKIEIKQIPFEPDAFMIHGCNFEFFNQLL